MLQTILNDKTRSRAGATFLLALAATLVAACGGGEAPKAKADAGELNVYSARHYDADEQLYALFEKETGIRLNRIEMKGDQLLERMAAEGEASPADVVLLVDAGNFWRAEERGLLQPVDSQALKTAIPARLRDGKDLWFGVAKRARVIAHDKVKIAPSDVSTYEALASPALRGQVCVRPSSNVYNLSLMAAMIDRWGPQKAEEWARGVVANFARPPEGSDTDQLVAIAEGRCGVALVNHYYWVRMSRSPETAEKAAKIALSFPDQADAGTHVNISGAALAAKAPNRDNAVRFLEFLVTPEAQTILAQANDEFPVLVSAGAGNAPLQEIANFKEAETPLDVLGERQAEAQKVFDRAGWR
jgi:iron(III) transport system substrate-binding protein